ncbi:MAG: glycoside hydrolase family 3 N-terminal domain-containing protein [Thermoanaerobaculum sp.]
MSGHPWLVCGVAGLKLSPEERGLLQALQPGGVILFARNLQTPTQAQELVASVRELPGNPYVAVDLEGGRVNRVRALVGELPTPQELSRYGEEAARALGEACGAVCAALGINVDLAPVVDVAAEASFLAEEGRCWGHSVEDVVRLAGAFLLGLESFGVSGCLKHFPGLGGGQVDSHRELPVLGDEVKLHRGVFDMLASPERAVMVAHALAPALGEAVAPASCSRKVVSLVPGEAGLVVADDVEMGALAAWGSLEERAAAALMAGCHQVLLCNALEARKRVAYYVDAWAEKDPALAAALERASFCVSRFARGSVSHVSWAEALERVREVQSLWGQA